MEELEYHFVDNREEMFNVGIQPAKPLLTNREYADRCPARSSSAMSTPSNSSGSSTTQTKYPSQGMPWNQEPPVVNRQLKPRNTPLNGVVESTEQQQQIKPRYPNRLAKDLGGLLSRLDIHKANKRDTERVPKNTGCNTPHEGLQSSERESSNNSIRYSLDLDAQQHMMLHQVETIPVSTERVTSRHQQHHEWPLTKDDVDQNYFVPVEKPCHIYDEQDWYIGTYDRAEAEHALHLVNQDGAFLVRTCSKYTPSEPYVLAVYHGKKVYNIKIRFLDSTNKYALGTGQRANDMFDSVADIIKFHTIFPIVLIDGTTNKYPGNCVLTYPITKQDVDKLLG